MRNDAWLFLFAIFPPVFEFRFDSDASSNLALLGKLWATVAQLADVFYCLLPCNRKPPRHNKWKLVYPALDQDSVAWLLQMWRGFHLFLTSPASTCFSCVSSFCHAGSSDDDSDSVAYLDGACVTTIQLEPWASSDADWPGHVLWMLLCSLALLVFYVSSKFASSRCLPGNRVEQVFGTCPCACKLSM